MGGEMFEALRRLLSGLWRNGHGDPDREDGEDRPDAITCEEALAHLFEYLDGELEGAERSRVSEHLEVCRRCYPRLEFERSFMEAVRRVRSGRGAPPELRDRVLEALRDEGLDPR